MQIQNIRMGFATNSSSSHSVVIVPSSKQLKDDVSLLCGRNAYGWEPFVLTSEQAKLEYFATQVFQRIRQGVGDEVGAATIRGLFGDVFDWAPSFVGDGATVSLPDYREWEEPTVDHQSWWGLPLQWDDATGHYWRKVGIDVEFLKDLFDFVVKRPDIAILGGNDNDSTDHVKKLKVKGVSNPLFRWDGKSSGLVARKDGDWWTVFNRKNGTKLRFSFKDKPKSLGYAQAPELVDLKITGYCEHKCPHCYQDSTPEGHHASTSHIEAVIRSLANMKVFEVAIGGGEPTDHPDFHKILEMCWHHGVVPNFSTRSMRWMHDERAVEAVRKYAGAFAFSVQNPYEVKDFYKLCIKQGLITEGRDAKSPTLQVALGSKGVGDSKYSFRSLLHAAYQTGLHLTLLGFKATGRAKDKKPEDYSWWISETKKLRDENKYPSISIDTTLAAEYKAQLKKMHISEMLYETADGIFSAYIDAVAHKMGSSSYVDIKKMVSYGDFTYSGDKNISEAWANVRKRIPKGSMEVSDKKALCYY